MNNMTPKDISFTSWAKQICIKHTEILDRMRKSTDPLGRAIAVRIIKTQE